MADAAAGRRVPVTRSHPLYVGGAFPRSESGRSYPVLDARGTVVAAAAQGSRRDARDAVTAARAALPGWSTTSGAGRGQVLYRVAEALEGRREQLATEVAAAEGIPPRRAAALVGASIDRWVWYVGWADKIAAVFGTSNAVAGPLWCGTSPEPVGVATLLAPQASSLLGLVSVVAPALATGGTAVVVASQQRPLPAAVLAEAFASSDVPPGVVNVLTGRTAELAPWLAAHAGVAALDLCGAPAAIRVDLERTAAATAKHVLPAPATEPDWTRPPDAGRLRAFLTTKTVWHSTGG